MEQDTTKRVRVEITETTLLRLLTGGQVCAADFRCLDCRSKQCLWNLCLRSCANGREKVFDEVLLQKAVGTHRR